MNQQPLKTLFGDIPPDKLCSTVDSVMIDYAIASVKDIQTQSADEAVNNIRNMKRLRDALYLTSKKNNEPLFGV